MFAQLAQGLERCGHEVTRAYKEPAPNPSGPEWVFPLASLNFRGYRALLKRVPAMLVSLWRLARGLYRIRPDVVNVHFVRAEAAYFLLLKWIFGYRLVLSFHGSDALRAAGHDLTVVPHLVRSADATTVVSERVGEAVKSIAYPASPSITVIPNGVPLDFWKASTDMEESEMSPRRRFNVVTVGRLVKIKGHDVLIQAFRILKRMSVDAELLIVGEGPERQMLEAEVKDAGLESMVTFAGRQSPEQVRSHLRKASAFALPSRSEGMPLSLLEAMATGLPAVATRVGGVPEVLTPEAGILVAPEEPEMFANALVTLLKEPSRTAAMGRAARERAQEYSSSRVVAAFDGLFRSLLQGSPLGKDPSVFSEVA